MRKDPRHPRVNRHANLNAPVTVYEEGDLPRLLKDKPDAIGLVLDCIQDPHNFGACLRTADAAGCAFVMIPRDRSAPLTDTVRQVACGAAESVPIVRVVNLARAIDALKELGVRIVGTADACKSSIFETNLSGPVALVLGAEGEGIRRLTAERCDELVGIPMLGDVPCLNVSVAAGVCLFEAVRQNSFS